MKNKEYENLRAEVARKYKQKFEDQQNLIKTLRDENRRLKDQKLELEEKNRELNDWIERLLEFMESTTDLTPEEIRAKVKSEVAAGQIKEHVNAFYSALGLDMVWMPLGKD